MTEPPDHEAIRQRANAATEGPWATGREYQPGGLKAHELVLSASYPLVELDDSEQGAADAEFIARAREDVPQLLDENQRRRGEVERLTRELAPYEPGRPGTPTYDVLAKAFGDLIDERGEWNRVVAEMGAEVEQLTAERDAMRPVVEKVRAWRGSWLTDDVVRDRARDLAAAWDAYIAGTPGVDSGTTGPETGAHEGAGSADGPAARVWALPDEPGPEVTAVRDARGLTWDREDNRWRRRTPSGMGGVTMRWHQLVADADLLTDATGTTS